MYRFTAARDKGKIQMMAMWFQRPHSSLAVKWSDKVKENQRLKVAVGVPLRSSSLILSCKEGNRPPKGMVYSIAQSWGTELRLELRF